MMDTAKLFRMEHYTITAPKVRNDGEPSGYHLALPAALKHHGIDGWTQHDSVGVWKGKAEPGTVFTVYLPEGPPGSPSVRLEILGRIGRGAMPDQDAVQVTYHGTLLLHEG
jgi:hypothetical protein